jgi:hypothetical protein
MSVSNESGAKLLAFTIDANTAQVVRFESLDATGERHELSDEEKASLARAGEDGRLENVVEQAFEAGIACVLGGGNGRDDARDTRESAEEAQLRDLLLTPLIEHSPAARLMHLEVLSRAILETLIQHSMKSHPADVSRTPSGGLQ